MKKNYVSLAALVVFFLTFGLTIFLHASEMSERIYNATRILESKQASRHPIPSRILRHAKGIAIFDTTKAGIGIGGQGGEGIILVKKDHSWSAPSAFDVGGASVGAQLGFTESRFIVVLMTYDAVHHFVFSQDVNWNATATETVGTDSETERASTSDLKHGSIIVYKNTNGVFGGATLGGTGIDRRDDVNRHAYGKNVTIDDIVNGKVRHPKSAKHLYSLLSK